MIGVTGVRATDTGLASCTVALCISSMSESSSDKSDADALPFGRILKGSGGPWRLVFIGDADLCVGAEFRDGLISEAGLVCARGIMTSALMAGAVSRYASAAFASATESCSFSITAGDEVELVKGFALFNVAACRLGLLSSTRALGVSDELVAEDNDRRVCESSCSLNEEAVVDGSSEMLVIIVGEFVDDDCVNFDSSSIFESCSWLGIDERPVLEPIVLRLSEALCVRKSEGAEGVVVALCASSMFLFRNCSAFINLSFSGVAVDASPVTEAGRITEERLSPGL